MTKQKPTKIFKHPQKYNTSHIIIKKQIKRKWMSGPKTLSSPKEAFPYHMHAHSRTPVKPLTRPRTHTYAHIHTHTYTPTPAPTHPTHLHAYLQTRAHTFIHTYKHYTCTYVRIYIRPCILTDTRAYMPKYMHTYLRSCPHPYITYGRRRDSHTKMTVWYNLRILFQRGEKIVKKVWWCDVKTVDSRQKKPTSSEVN